MNAVVFQFPHKAVTILTSVEPTVLLFQRVAQQAEYPLLTHCLQRNREDYVLADLQYSQFGDETSELLQSLLDSSTRAVEFCASAEPSPIYLLFRAPQEEALVLCKFSVLELFTDATLLQYVQIMRSSSCFMQRQYYESKSILIQKSAEAEQVAQLLAIALDDYKALEQEFESMQSGLDREALCAKCKQHLCKVLVLPCSHLSACLSCATSALTECPTCSRSVSRMHRVYF